MRTFRLNKLVRDGIVAHMQILGEKVQFRTLSDSEYIAELQRKIVEEAGELDFSSPDAIKELADVQEALNAANQGTSA